MGLTYDNLSSSHVSWFKLRLDNLVLALVQRALLLQEGFRGYLGMRNSTTVLTGSLKAEEAQMGESNGSILLGVYFLLP